MRPREDRDGVGEQVDSAALARARWAVGGGARPVLVAAPAVDAEHVLEMAATDDENSVETISAESADPAFGVSVRVRRVGFVNSIRP
jgi:hypothetical protein